MASTSELRTDALGLRESDLSYQRIADELGLSKGEAHRLVQGARKACREKAERLIRPPSHQQTRDEARVLFKRLVEDADRVYGIATDHCDAAALARAWSCINEQFTIFEELLGQDGGSKQGLRPASRRCLNAFHRLLNEAAGRCGGLTDFGGGERVALAFRADLLQLAGLISPRMRITLSEWDGVNEPAPGFGEAGKRRQLSSKERELRNRSIVMSRAHHRTFKEIAQEHGLSTKQVERIVKQSKGELPDLDHDSAEEVARAVSGLVKEAAQPLREWSNIKELDMALERSLGAISMMRSLGLVPEGGLDQSLEKRPHPVDVASSLNGCIRELFAAEGRVGEPLMEAVIEAVLEHLVPEHAGALRDEAQKLYKDSSCRHRPGTDVSVPD